MSPVAAKAEPAPLSDIAIRFGIRPDFVAKLDEDNAYRAYWTPQRVDRLALLWASGLSATGCATKMGPDCTKGMVIGAATKRRNAGDVRFYDRHQTKPDTKHDAQRYLGTMALNMIGEIEPMSLRKQAAQLGIHSPDVHHISKGAWAKFSVARLLQILERLGATVQVEATISLNGVAEAVILPLGGRSPI